MNLTMNLTLERALTGNSKICPESGPKNPKLTAENVSWTMLQSLTGLLKRNIVDPTFQDPSPVQGTQ